VVVGGGIGGLAAAVALGRRGWRADVYESADELRPVGKGIGVPVNAMQVLDRLGLATAVSAAGWPLERAELWTTGGSVLTTIEFGPMRARYGQGMVAIRRSELVRVLAAALPPGTLHLGWRLQAVATAPDRVTAVFQEGTMATGDVLVGADGIRSAVRGAVLPRVALRYSGQTCYRGICDVALPARLASASVEVWGGRHRFGFLPVGAGQVYWFAPITHPAGRADDLDLAARYGHFPAPVPELIARTPPEDVIRTDLFDFRPIRRWHAGRVVLVGDAAHAMTPNLGQGGGQAIEDAYVLADLLGGHQAPGAALAGYERVRMPRVRWIVNTAWRIGRVAHWENRVARWLRDRALAWTPAWVSRKSFDRMFALDD
jgi:2-polyprenyl-6-methoxyphenol hydroxylase-like FAD-dependent oxidoreductase